MPEETWSCMVCDDVRPDSKISVYTKIVNGITVNIRYCNDRPSCFEGAKKHRMIEILGGE